MLCVFLISGGLWAQQTSVAGTVTDESGLPLPGATIIVENTNRGVTTDFDGNYSFEAHYKEVCGLMQNVEIFVSADGGTEAKLRTLMLSDFQVGPTGLPRATFTVTLAEVQNTISFSGGSNVAIRLQLNLTDGRSFTAKDAASSLTGSYFASPYQYNLIVGCFVTDGSAIPGKYTMNMVDSYGDGERSQTSGRCRWGNE